MIAYTILVIAFIALIFKAIGFKKGLKKIRDKEAKETLRQVGLNRANRVKAFLKEVELMITRDEEDIRQYARNPRENKLTELSKN